MAQSGSDDLLPRYQPNARLNILIFSGSPRQGNCEAIALRLKEMLDDNGARGELIWLREKRIGRCDGCVEHCNKALACKKDDDMTAILERMLAADGYVFITPSYFQMPPGLFKDFIDRCSVFYTAKTDLSKKRTVVIAVGADSIEGVDVYLKNITDNFCKTLGIPVVVAKSFQGRSEFKEGDAEAWREDIFRSGLNLSIEKELQRMAEKLATNRR